MKETIRIAVRLEPAEEEALDLVFETLERMTFIYEERYTDEIIFETEEGKEVKIPKELTYKAIQALEEIFGEEWK